MPTKQNDIPKPDAPKDMKVSFIGKSKPLSTEQYEAIQELAGLLVEHNKQTGMTYNRIAISTEPKTDKYVLVDNFGVSRKNARIGFAANIETLMGLIANKDELLVPIAHESGHLMADNFSSRDDKLRVASAIFESAGTLAEQLKKHPDLAKEYINRKFGSIAALDNLLVRFSIEVIPIMQAIQAESDFYSATPEKMTRMIEADAPSYIKVRELIKKLPKLESMGRIALGLREVNDDIFRHSNTKHWRNAQNTKGELTPKEASLLNTLYTLADNTPDHRLKIFIEFFSKAEEYFADSNVLKSVPDASISMQVLANQVGDNLLHEGPSHPSPARRMMRLDALGKNGEPPPDNVLRPGGYYDNCTFIAKGLTPMFAQLYYDEMGKKRTQKSWTERAGQKQEKNELGR